ncbi:MAG: MBL fold metallo-hydrolase [Pseudobutyrivibrio ruminis]|nr:MBL fold metallo-hydrolase [Pseudobutyrivibrio ruminis]
MYTHEKINERIYIIREGYAPNNGLTIGLVIGDKKAAIIDSGMGVIATLRSYIEKITDKPIICIVTHGHPDHVGGAALFDEVYMNNKDAWILDWALPLEKRLSDMDEFSSNNKLLRIEAEKNPVICENLTYKNMEDGDVFDLGGITLKMYKLPGHTPGSLAAYCDEEKIAFASDAIISNIVLSDENRNGIQTCENALRRFMDSIDVNTVIYSGHSQQPLPRELAYDLLAAYEEILSNKTGDDMITHFKFAEEIHPGIRLKKHVHGSATVTYNVDLV